MSKLSQLGQEIGTADVRVQTRNHYLTSPSPREGTKQEIKLLGLCKHKQATAIGKKQKNYLDNSESERIIKVCSSGASVSGLIAGLEHILTGKALSSLGTGSSEHAACRHSAPSGSCVLN